MPEQNDNLIYVIDDDAVMRMSCQQILSREGFDVKTFEDGLEGLQRIEEMKPQLIVVDLKMPKIGGMEVISRVHEMDPEIIIVVITGYATIDTAIEAMKAGAYDFLPKPFTPAELRLIIKRGLERKHLIEESNRLKSEKIKMQRHFVTFVSHQLQSPLVAVQQYLDVLKHLGNIPEKEQLQTEWIDRSLTKIKELLEIIRDWLKISKIESGSLTDCIEPNDIFPIIKDIKNTYEKQASEKSVTIIIDLPEKAPSPVRGDKECLNVLISNIVVNAIKYNRVNGTVTIRVVQKGDFVNVIISDTGIGIDEKDMDIIFEEFVRIKNETTENITGTGLGLPICKKIIQELGGTINVQSKINEGTTFTVGLPICEG